MDLTHDGKKCPKFYSIIKLDFEHENMNKLNIVYSGNFGNYVVRYYYSKTSLSKFYQNNLKNLRIHFKPIPQAPRCQDQDTPSPNGGAVKSPMPCLIFLAKENSKTKSWVCFFDAWKQFQK